MIANSPAVSHAGVVEFGRTPAAPRSLVALQLGAEASDSLNGGLVRYYHELLAHLPAAGVRCRGLVVGRNGIGESNDIRTFAPMDAPLLRRWSAERDAIAQEMSAQRFDLVAAHFALYALPALRNINAKLPLVVHFHGPWAAEARVEGESWLARAAKSLAERRVYRRAGRVIVLSQAFGRMLHDDFGIPENRISVVPGGIDCDRFEIADSRAAARSALGWPADRPIVLTVRRLVRRVGLENLVDAIAELRKRVPDVLLLIAGTGAMRQALESRIADQGLAQHVRLLGFVPEPDLPRAYRAADLSVVPSMALEGFGLAAGESLASGTPVLVTPVGGLPEVVGALPGNWVFPSTDPAAMAAMLAERLRQPNLLPDSQTCQRYVRQHFDWPVIARRVRDVYQEALA